MIESYFTGDYIQLNQFLKKENIAMSGGEAKLIIESGTVYVNGEVADAIRKKLHDGDRVVIEDVGEYILKTQA